MLEMLHFGREGRIRHDLLSTLTRPKLDANETRSEKLFYSSFEENPGRICLYEYSAAVSRRGETKLFRVFPIFRSCSVPLFSLLAKIRGPNFGSLASPYLHFTLDSQFHTSYSSMIQETEWHVNGARGILHPMSYQGTLSPRRLCLC